VALKCSLWNIGHGLILNPKRALKFLMAINTL